MVITGLFKQAFFFPTTRPYRASAIAPAVHRHTSVPIAVMGARAIILFSQSARRVPHCSFFVIDSELHWKRS
ncbi:hypothetical protein EVAR_17283_1 [Eumeta japonica]|uniref:Uncharacterized protein n=1 Tax=Eumeta variegata TaxID=151549 RepID=A0A4C1TTD2_EUMVA|nr:hypothetical protein EVAR_17283_1 [Eumeta japonica]